MTCPRCAVTNPPGTRFCSLCGLRLPSADAQAAAPQPGQFQGYAGTPVPGYPPGGPPPPDYPPEHQLPPAGFGSPGSKVPSPARNTDNPARPGIAGESS